MSSSLAKKVLKRRALNSLPNFFDDGFKLQEDFIMHPSRQKALFGTRRLSKSSTAGKYIFKTALENPGVSILYIGLTKESARRIMIKDVIKPLARKYKIDIKINYTTLSVTFPGGAIAYLMGVDSSEEEKDKILGQKYKLAIIDEGASYTIDLRELVHATLKPAMIDLDGTIVMLGTPGNLTKSFFYDVTTGKEPGWHVVKGTAYDNPFVAKNWAAEIEKLKKDNPYIVETPMFKQMYLGEWVVDEDALVYKYNSDRNVYTDLPVYSTGEWQHLLGVDLGYEDDSAFVVIAYHEYNKTNFIVDCFSKSKMDITDVANKIKEIKQKYNIYKVVIDGANKQAVEEIQKRHQTPLITADKTGKYDFIQILNSDLIAGNIKINKGTGQKLIEEMQGLVWKEKGLKKEENPACPNHLCDAFLYIWRYCYSYFGEKPKPKTIPYTPEWYNQQVSDMELAAEEHFSNLESNEEPWDA